MDLKQQQEFFQAFVKTMEETMLKKGNDYSNQDRLSNFKTSASILNVNPEQVCLVLISVKVARLGNLITNGVMPNNESVADTLLDLANYTLLLAMIIKDKNIQP